MGIIAEQWLVGESVQLPVQRLSGLHGALGVFACGVPGRAAALRFPRCRSVHGMFLREPLDVLFVDRDGAVLRVTRLEPWRVVYCPGAAETFELRAGEASRLAITPGTRMKNIC
ncbi:MAG: DUF192 domain-containing protein [Solirubrobacterales bacterium]